MTVDSHSEVQREEKRFTVTGTPDLRLTTFDGSIQIQSWDKPDVLVEIERRGPTKASLESIEVIANQKGDRIDLEVKRPRSESYRVGFHRTPSASLIVSVPRDVNIVARTGDGSIKIERVNGRIELRTGDGSIRAAEVSGELEFNTSDGSVGVQKAHGRLSVDTGDGSVDVGGMLVGGQAAYRRRIRGLPRRPWIDDERELGHHDRRWQCVPLSADGIRRRARRAHR